MTQPTFFATLAHFREWLEKHHTIKTELIVGYYKKATGKPSITWPESVEQALCFGWIDGIRRNLDDERYTIRFTPRRPGSVWSGVNLKLITTLKKAGLMTPEGLKVYDNRKTDHPYYAYEQNRVVPLSKEFEATFKKNKKAWTYFQTQRLSYRRPCTRWVMSARQQATRERRLGLLIESSARHEWMPQMLWGKKST